MPLLLDILFDYLRENYSIFQHDIYITRTEDFSTLWFGFLHNLPRSDVMYKEETVFVAEAKKDFYKPMSRFFSYQL